jgi:hypothetical protein
MLREQMKRLTRNLLANSIEAFILALETVNRPSIKYRTESFCFLFCNAWELLMKAKLLNDDKKIFYPKKYKQPRRSLSLDDCLNRIFTSDNDPVKLNIKTIHELRNNATHLVIPFIPIDIMGLFQAGVLNYPKMLQEWFGISLSDRVPLGMMALVYDFDPTEYSLEHPKMRRKMPIATVRWLTSFQRDIRNQATSLGNTIMQFYIPIDLKLAIVKNPSKADIVLSSSATAEQEALIVEVSKDVDKTHPYRSKEVAELVSERLVGKPIVNAYDILSIRKVYNIERRPEFYYKAKFWAPLYSELFVEWIVNQATKHSDFFKRVRAKYKERQDRLRKVKNQNS